MLTKLITATLIAAVAFVVLPKPAAYAGDEEWATAGKVLAGVAVAAIIHEVATSHRGDSHGVQGRYAMIPARRVRYVRSPRRVWVPGRFEIRTKRHWVEGRWDKIWIEPEYRRVKVVHYGRRGHPRTTWKEVLVREGHYKKVWREGFWETRQIREWIPGHWEYGRGRDDGHGGGRDRGCNCSGDCGHGRDDGHGRDSGPQRGRR